MARSVTGPKIVAVYGSPRRKGNTATLLNRAVGGASDAGAQVEEIVLRDLKMSPCLEIYGCNKAGECRLKDDFQQEQNRKKSKVRSRVEHVFAYIEAMHGGVIRCIGRLRAAAKIGLLNLVYNMRRFAYLEARA